MASDGCAGWRDHVIVCGLEGVGLRTVELLHHTGVPVVVVDDQPDDRLVHLVDELDIPRLTGSARLPATLRDAGIAGARAMLCLQANDLDVLETVLLAREVAPDLRVVTRLANPAAARAVAEVVGERNMLDFAQLVAPAIVESCLGRSLHEFELAGEPFATASVAAPRAGTLRELFGDLAPVAIATTGAAGEREVVACPGRDEPVIAGDVVTLIGTPEELEEGGVVLGERMREHRRERPSRQPFELVRRSIRGFFADAGRTLPAIVVALLVLVAGSTAVITTSYVGPDGHHLGVLRSLYFTAETLATVGFGDYNYAGQSDALIAFAIMLIVLGALLLATFFALLTNLLITRRIAQAFGRYRVPGMERHLVVVGLGSLGVRVVELLLDAELDVVVVDRDESNRHLDWARAHHVPVVAADASLPEVLGSVNLDRARGVAVLTSDDLTNIETGLAAREVLGARWQDVPVAIRLFDHVLARTVGRNFGFRNVRSISDLAAPWFVGAALGLPVLATLSVEQQPFFVGRLSVTAGGGLEGLAMFDLSARIRVIAIRRSDGRLESTPRRTTTFAAGDEAFLIGPSEELITVLRRDERMHPGSAGANGVATDDAGAGPVTRPGQIGR